MFQDRKFWPQGINMYVPAMQGSAEFMSLQPVVFDLGKPALSNASVVATGINLQAVAGVEALQTLNWVSDAPYGRQISLTPSGVPGGAGSVTRLIGWDYLGQPIAEDITIGAAVATAVFSDKAFYRFWKARSVTAAANAVTGTVGTGPKLGLPYKGMVAWIKEDGVLINRFEITAGKIVVPDVTDPATSTSNDPRGTIECVQALNGVRTVIVGLIGDPQVNAAGNGGLHGIRQFGG